MRVVAGEFKGRRLRAPRGMRTRPTADRVREALFSMLGDVSGAHVLDLYAGTGALGIEALSRGAGSALFGLGGGEDPFAAHAQRIIDHLVERDQKVTLPAISAPPAGWQSALELCDHVLRNEQEVTASINDLYAVAEKTKDRGAVILLQWFVTEQMEEEAAARGVLGRIRLAGNTGVGLLMIDQELAGGSVPGMPPSPTDAHKVRRRAPASAGCRPARAHRWARLPRPRRCARRNAVRP